jgi:hypothetical protein
LMDIIYMRHEKENIHTNMYVSASTK